MQDEYYVWIHSVHKTVKSSRWPTTSGQIVKCTGHFTNREKWISVKLRKWQSDDCRTSNYNVSHAHANINFSSQCRLVYWLKMFAYVFRRQKERTSKYDRFLPYSEEYLSNIIHLHCEKRLMGSGDIFVSCSFPEST